MRIIGKQRDCVKRWRESGARVDTILFNLNGILFMRVSDRQPEKPISTFQAAFGIITKSIHFPIKSRFFWYRLFREKRQCTIDGLFF